MNIITVCSSCKKDLEIEAILTTMNGLYNITVEVLPCHNIDCYDCGKCEVGDTALEENNILREEIQELSTKIESAKEKLT